MPHQQAQRPGGQLPGRGPVSDRSPARLPGEDLEAADEDLLLLGSLEIADALVDVTVAAHLVPAGDDGRHRFGMMLGHPRRDEEGRCDIGVTE